MYKVQKRSFEKNRIYNCRSKKIWSSYEVQKRSFEKNKIYNYRSKEISSLYEVQKRALKEINLQLSIKRNLVFVRSSKTETLKKIKFTIVDRKKSRLRTKFKSAFWKKINLQLSIEKNLFFVRSSEIKARTK